MNIQKILEAWHLSYRTNGVRRMNPVDTIEAALTLDQVQELAEPSLMRAFQPESIHQLLDELLGDFEEDDSLLCL